MRVLDICSGSYTIRSLFGRLLGNGAPRRISIRSAVRSFRAPSGKHSGHLFTFVQCRGNMFFMSLDCFGRYVGFLVEFFLFSKE